jgi:hypothetical protein
MLGKGEKLRRRSRVAEFVAGLALLFLERKERPGEEGEAGGVQREWEQSFA